MQNCAGWPGFNMVVIATWPMDIRFSSVSSYPSMHKSSVKGRKRNREKIKE
jgi:hypothetical protein